MLQKKKIKKTIVKLFPLPLTIKEFTLLTTKEFTLLTTKESTLLTKIK